MLDAEQQELLLAFVEEGYELLDESEPLLIELETRAGESGEVDRDVLDTIFRLYHSLKGGAGFLGLETVGKVTHEAETLLDLFRKGRSRIQSDHIDLLNQTCDFLRQLLGSIESSFDDAGFEEEAQGLIAALQEKIATIKETAASRSSASHPGITKTEGMQGGEAKGRGLPAASEPDVEADELVVTPEIMKQFVSESEELLAAAEDALLNLEKEPSSQQHLSQAFRALHSFKGNSGFLALGDLERLSHHLENVLDKIRCGELSGDGELFSLILEMLDFLRDGLAKLVDGGTPEIPSLPGLTHMIEDAIAERQGGRPGTAPVAHKTVKEGDRPQEAQVQKDRSSPPRAGKKAQQSRRPKPALQRQSIRVDVEKLDTLLDLVGELVIAEAMVSQNPDLRRLEVPLERFEKASMHLNKITRDLQDISTSIRMIPLSATFRRMIRLVRDLSQKTGKKVDFQILGEETEVDKTVIEQITDPLVHIIRNAIDHGVGTPEERKQRGKPETAKLVLEAKYAGGEVWISVKDDGMGLNREKILAKAKEKGLVAGDGSDMRYEDVCQLIFLPGFSTADQVTDVSGRGVGMDVVRRNIEQIRGKVDMRSQPGVGTEVTLRLPLTLAIIDGMIVRVGAHRYIIPIAEVKETLKPAESHIIVTMDGQEFVDIRGEVLPIIRLHEFFRVQPRSAELHQGILVIVETDTRTLCLFVDELLGQHQVVIKGLSQYVGKLSGISGCTILGDGDVSLIIDVAGLASTVETRSLQNIKKDETQEATLEVV